MFNIMRFVLIVPIEFGEAILEKVGGRRTDGQMS